jgi:signal transduction histidine kinase
MQPAAVDKFGEIFPHMESILHCGVYIHHCKNNSTLWSPGVFRILGLDEKVQTSSFDLFSHYIVVEDKARVVHAIGESRKTGIPYELEFSIVNAAGEYKRIHAQNTFRTPLNVGGEYEGVLRDITENYFYKKALEQKVKQLDKSNQALQEFVYIASHDLQEPLRKISTFVGRLKSRFDGKLGEEGGMYIDRTLHSTQNMQTLLEDLLSFSRLSFTDKKFEEVSLQQCLDAALSDLEIKIEESGATIESDPLPEVEGYPVQLQQLLNNLVGNAIKFRRTDRPCHIKVSCRKLQLEPSGPERSASRPFVEISVKDNGIGFEPEFSERIFQIFQRLNGRSEYGGSGVGLSICKRIVENHHGYIGAIGSPGAGAVFTVQLPVKQN